MSTQTKRATIYLDAELHRVLRLKAAETERTISELVNEAVKVSLAEEHEDLEAIEQRRREPNLVFADVLKDLRRRGRI
jgi:SepF-like predicted cell division protein (DUF552 family)